MVLMREGRSEKGHYPIALNTVDDAVVAMNGVLHRIQNGLHAAPSFFGVNRGDELSGIANIREQYGQALSFSTAGGQGTK
jgi:hypothetical protein